MLNHFAMVIGLVGLRITNRNRSLTRSDPHERQQTYGGQPSKGSRESSALFVYEKDHENSPDPSAA